MSEEPANFDRIARPYRWLEYLSFGRALEHTRFQFLPDLQNCRRALILGDGDGRFTAQLLASNSSIHVDAVDSSAAMLHLLTERAAKCHPTAQHRLTTIQHDALAFAARPRTPEEPYDLVVTHFFLDCLEQEQVAALVQDLRPRLTPNGRWLVSEFAVPDSQPAALAARLLIATLYQAFALLTGLSTRKLPDYATIFQESGLNLLKSRERLSGLLVSQLWRLTALRQPLSPANPPMS
jgi:ubiquinone/menaquinone biosynthesis C-methylase UbiE